MRIIVNGVEEQCVDSINLEAFVFQKKYDKDRIAIEVNGEIISKSRYINFILSENDKIEVVSFVGGG